MKSVLHAASLAEAQEALRQANAQGISLLPIGNQTRLARCLPDAQPDSFLSLSGMDQILGLDAEDWVCRVEPGLSPQALEQSLQGLGLELGVRSPGATNGTLGGLFMAPEVSLFHSRWGPPRDQVLGARWLLADGSLVTTGSSVVKSVAGYDVTRLFLGSRGRLAVCVEMILRLRPRARRSQWWTRQATAFPSSERSGLDLAFSLPGEDVLYLRGDALAVAATDTWENCEPQKGRAALARCLDAFATCGFRLTHAQSRDIRLEKGPVDWLSHQQGFKIRPELLPPSSLLHPPTQESPWLTRLQLACTPKSLPLGGLQKA